MILDYLAAITLWLSMIAYAVLGGADFGGGFWDLFSLGAQAEEKRHFISRAVGPVWEANNVWLIYLVVGLYTAFPVVAQTLAIALLLPLSLALIGIVLRGAAFSFRAHIAHAVPVRAIWGRLFSAASIITPFLFGACAAAVASGQIHFHQGHIPVALVSAWLTPFALVVGAMAVALCATLAPIYLTVEAQHAKNEVLMSAFRKRAFIGGSCMAVFGLLGLGLAPSEAPLLWHGMIDHAIWAVIVTVLLGAATAGALFYRRYRTARVLIILETGAVLGTWGLAQLPYIIPPDLTITNAASPPTTLWEFLVSAAVGMSLLLPSLWFLFHVFKGQNPVPRIHEKQVEEG